jgi:hypothetical protein
VRKLPTIVAGAFLAIQLQRVADFVGHGLGAGPFLGWAFAIGIAAAVFTSAYWTRQSITRKDEKEDKRDVQAQVTAWCSLIVFVSLDGTFNLAETLRVLVDQTLRLPAIIYGVSPTVAAAILGMLQGRIDRLPVAPRKSRTGSVLDAISAAIVRFFSVEPTEQPAETPVAPVVPASIPAVSTIIYECDVPGCRWSTEKNCKPVIARDPDKAQRAYAGHKRSHSRKAIKSEAVQYEEIKVKQ